MQFSFDKILSRPNLTFASIVSLIVSWYIIWGANIYPNVFWGADAGGKFIHLQQLYTSHHLSYDIPYPGRDLDPELRFVPFSAHHYTLKEQEIQSWWPIWFPLLSIGGFVLSGVRGIYALPLVSGLFAVGMIYLLTRRLVSGFTLASIIIGGLATPIFFYSFHFWEHTLATFLALLSLWLWIIAYDKNKRNLLIWGGMCLALALAVRQELILLLAAAGGAALSYRFSWKQYLHRVGWFLTGTLLASLPLWAGNLYARGTWLEYHKLTYPEIGLTPFSYLQREGIEIIADLITGAGIQGDPEIVNTIKWFFALAAFISSGAYHFYQRTKEGTLVNTFFWLLTANALLWLFVLSAAVLLDAERYFSLHGIFLVAPYLLCTFFLPVTELHDGRPHLRFVVFTVWLYLIAYVVAVAYRSIKGGVAGVEWGARYILTIYPLMAILSLAALDSLLDSASTTVQKNSFVVIYALLVLISMGHQVRGVYQVYSDKKIVAVWDDFFTHTPDDIPIVTDYRWLPYDLATQYYRKKMFKVQDIALPDHWGNYQKGKLSEWMDLAFTRGQRQFYFFTFNQSNLDVLQTATYTVSGERVFTGRTPSYMRAEYADDKPEVYCHLLNLSPR